MKTASRLLALLCLFGFAFSALAEEKVVWCPKDGIGKSQMWKTKATADVADNVLKIKLTDAEWSGVGLNWEGYWPEDAGVKAADYKFFEIELKVEGNADNLQLAIKDNKHKPSTNVTVKKYCPDGKLPADFVTIKIPVSDLMAEKCEFVSGIAWEVMLHMWTQDAKDVTISVRKVAFSKD